MAQGVYDVQLIDNHTHKFWQDYAGLAQRHGLEFDDVHQQGWMLYMGLTYKKALYKRLMDWLRAESGFRNFKKTPPPRFVSVDEHPGVLRQHSYDMDVETPEHRRFLWACAAQLGPRYVRMLHLNYLGYSAREIGAHLGVTEGRVSQMFTVIKDTTQGRLEC